MNYIVFGISIVFISWMVGMILDGLLKNTTFYDSLSHLNFIRDEHLNNRLGLNFFKWIVKNTFFKYFNQKLKFRNKTNLPEFSEIRKEMTYSEISHLIGFVFVTIVAIYKAMTIDLFFGFVIMLCNILLNLYPSLLQQKNKRRIDKLIKRIQTD